MNLLLYFWIFLKASLFSTGGLGNLPFLQQDLTAQGWARSSDFVTAIAVGQVSPGPTGLWSISLGYLTYGWAGAGLALIAVSLPPLLVLVVNGFYNRMQNSQMVQDFTRGLALAVVGLTLAVSWNLAAESIVDAYGILIALFSLGMALSKRIPVLVILLFSALAGLLLYG